MVTLSIYYGQHGLQALRKHADAIYGDFTAVKLNDKFQLKTNIFLIFAQNIDRGYTLEPILTSTHDLCFRAKIRKKCIPL